MKFTHKKFPKCNECEFQATSGGKCRALKDDVCPKDNWKNNQEKELREWGKALHTSVETCLFIKEILEE